MNKINVENKFPLLWRIPWFNIGERFFTHKTEITTKTDLIIQITPTIVRDNYTGINKTEIHQETESMFDNFQDEQKDSEEVNEDK